MSLILCFPEFEFYVIYFNLNEIIIIVIVNVIQFMQRNIQGFPSLSSLDI